VRRHGRPQSQGDLNTKDRLSITDDTEKWGKVIRAANIKAAE
jgi:hypothetical protein